MQRACHPSFNSRSPSGERPLLRPRVPSYGRFNSRSPSGERQTPPNPSRIPPTFQLTLPERGATLSAANSSLHALRFNSRSPSGERRLSTACISFTLCVSTHAPRAGSDYRCFKHRLIIVCFNSRSPSGERHVRVPQKYNFYSVSTHAPRAGSDAHIARDSASLQGFQLTLPERGATYSAKVPLFIGTSKGISRTVIRESFLHQWIEVLGLITVIRLTPRTFRRFNVRIRFANSTSCS